MIDYLNNLIENEDFKIIFIFIMTIISLVIVYVFLKIIFHFVSGKKKPFSKYIYRKLSLPIFLLIIFSGIYLFLINLSELQSFYQKITDIYFIILTLLCSLLISRILHIALGSWLKIRRGLERTPKLISSFFSIIVYIIAIVIILGYFKLDITPLIAGVGLGALAIGLALQSTLANFFAGLHLISDHPIRVGDFIELENDLSGTVDDIGWRSTRIKTLTDNLLIIPNSKLADSNITNFSMPKQDLLIFIPCGAAYDSDLIKVERVTLEVAKEIQNTVEGAVKEYQPLFRFKEFGDSNINFIAILKVSEPMKRFTVRNEFIKLLKQRFDNENIEISWPIRKIYNIK
jgi:small-conductance mechanosensitive channel